MNDPVFDEICAKLDRDFEQLDKEMKAFNKLIDQCQESDRQWQSEASKQAAQAYQQQQVSAQANATGDRPIYNGVAPGSPDFEALKPWDKVAATREFEAWQKKIR